MEADLYIPTTAASGEEAWLKGVIQGPLAGMPHNTVQFQCSGGPELKIQRRYRGLERNSMILVCEPVERPEDRRWLLDHAGVFHSPPPPNHGQGERCAAPQTIRHQPHA